MRLEIVQIIDGIEYDTRKAEVVASDEYWDGSNFERRGRNEHLYKTKNGRFFVGFSTQWIGELDDIKAVSKEEAAAIYENLPEHEMSYEEAFEIKPEEA